MWVENPFKGSAGAASLLLLLVAHLGQPTISQIRIAPPDARLEQGFTYVKSIRELADGSLLISDPSEMRLVAANLRTGAVTSVARRGEGPDEFRCIGELWPLGADSTLMVDANCADDWLLIVGTRAAGKWNANNSPLVRAVRSGAGAVTLINGVDRMGSIAVTRRLVRPQWIACPPYDSVPIIRFNRTGNTADTLTKGIWTRPGYYGTSCSGEAPRGGGGSGGGGGGNTNSPPGTTFRIHLSESSVALMYPDGAVAVAHFNPYRVDWCTPGARSCIRGPTIADRPIYTEADKRVFLESREAWFRRPQADPARYPGGWPTTVPPFVSRAGLFRNVFAMPDGRLLIERVPTARRPANTYDIIDRQGMLSGTVSLPVQQRIVGFGPRSVYTAVLDADDIERVQRHPWL